MKFKLLIPLFVFIILLGFLLIGLGLDPKKVPSPLINKPVPEFTLAQLVDSSKNFSPKEMLGKVWMLNVWASWCASCRIEHPLLMKIAAEKTLPIIGLNWKDEKPDALQVLKKTGDPFELSIFDPDNRVGLNFGVYGTPETFVIDKKGLIRHKYIGPLTVDAWQKEFLPLIDKLKAES